MNDCLDLILEYGHDIRGVLMISVVMCQVLEEMLDNGFPLATESNILMVRWASPWLFELMSVAFEAITDRCASCEPVCFANVC